MKPSHEFALRALGIISPHPEQGQPQAPAGRHRDLETGRFIAPPGVTLNGGYQTPPPPPPRTPETIVQEHNRLIAELLGPTDLGA